MNSFSNPGGMPWRYDLFVCPSSDTHEGAHGEHCRGWWRSEMFETWRWPDSFQRATQHPHAVVLRVGIDICSGSVSRAFEHIEGGGLCEFSCGRRGVLRRGCVGGAQFMCETCATEHRAAWLALSGNDFGYPPVIDDAVAELNKRSAVR